MLITLVMGLSPCLVVALGRHVNCCNAICFLFVCSLHLRCRSVIVQEALKSKWKRCYFAINF